MSKKKPVDKLSIKQLAAIVDKKRAILDYLKQAEDELKVRLRDGGECDRYHMKPVTAGRKWEDEDAAVKKLRSMGYTLKSLTKQSFLSPAQVEALTLPKKADKDDVTLAIAGLLKEQDPVYRLTAGPAPEKSEGALAGIFKD
jgi:hypothetical protein